jgi:hypothetical protein
MLLQHTNLARVEAIEAANGVDGIDGSLRGNFSLSAHIGKSIKLVD